MRSSFQATSGLYGPSMAGRIMVGTSSWADPGFVKEWYPPRMPARERLPWYAQRFVYVELNSSFYAVPDRNTVHKLVEETAPLAEAGKLGAYLVQLTPAFAPRDHELDELNGLVAALQPHPVAVELRHRGWVRDKRRDQTLGWFSENEVA